MEKKEEEEEPDKQVRPSEGKSMSGGDVPCHASSLLSPHFVQPKDILKGGFLSQKEFDKKGEEVVPPLFPPDVKK